MSDDLIRDRLAGLGQRRDGLLEIDRVPQTDGGNHQIQAAGLPLLFLPVAIGEASATIKPERSSQLIAKLTFVQPYLSAPTKFGVLEPVQNK